MSQTALVTHLAGRPVTMNATITIERPDGSALVWEITHLDDLAEIQARIENLMGEPDVVYP